MHKNIFQIQIQCDKAPGGWLHFFPVAHDTRGDIDAWAGLSIIQAKQPDFLELWEAQEGEDIISLEEEIFRALRDNPTLAGTIAHGTHAGGPGMAFTNPPFMEIYSKGLIVITSSGGMDV